MHYKFYQLGYKLGHAESTVPNQGVLPPTWNSTKEIELAQVPQDAVNYSPVSTGLHRMTH